MNNRLNVTRFILGLVAILSALTVIVCADSDDPYGVRVIDYISSSRPTVSNISTASVDTAAGNITEINLTAISTTKAWAGYFGNITGTLTLENSAGNVFYNWTSLEPKGEIYASTSNTITWELIKCFDYAAAAPEVNLSTENIRFGINEIDADAINNTFNLTQHPAFEVGTNPIAINTCPSTYVFGSTGYQTADWSNVLLTDTSSLIFTTIIENKDIGNNTNKEGFDNRLHDFQLLVAEDGHDGQEDATTLYYFWAEIN
jgi:hypothetical protein